MKFKLTKWDRKTNKEASTVEVDTAEISEIKPRQLTVTPYKKYIPGASIILKSKKMILVKETPEQIGKLKQGTSIPQVSEFVAP